MGKEHHKVIAHNFHVRIEGSVEFSFKLQSHHRGLGRFVTCSRSEVHEVDFQVSLSGIEAKGACEDGIMYIHSRKCLTKDTRWPLNPDQYPAPTPSW
jgi:hypothetical protein